MHVDELLSRLDMVKPRGPSRWTAKCPSHSPDRHPSLQITEGEKAILLKCWPGCSVDEICQALGIEPKDLFYDSHQDLHARRTVQPQAPRWDWRRTANQLEFHGDCLWLRGRQVLDTAKRLNVSNVIDDDLNSALDALASAYRDLERAAMFLDFGVKVRTRGLAQEKERVKHESRH